MSDIEGIVQFCVMIAGFLNAGAIGLQANAIQKAKDSTGHAPVMYFIFLFIQLSLVANAAIHKDAWQASGMLASMATTAWVIVLIFRWRKTA